MKNYLRVLITLIFIGSFTQIKAQDITTLVQKVKNKLEIGRAHV